jgi:tify domain
MVGVRSQPELSLKLGSSHDNSPRDEITNKKMTIFFNGEMRVLDVTEIQVCVLFFLFQNILFCLSNIYIYI